MTAGALAPTPSLSALSLAGLPSVHTAAPIVRAQLPLQPQIEGGAALLAALASKSIPRTLALRALAAYQKSLQLKG
ncbi:MAG: hypothetical protein ACP5QR_05675 [Rhizomicrobium sp.]